MRNRGDIGKGGERGKEEGTEGRAEEGKERERERGKVEGREKEEGRKGRTTKKKQ